MFVFVPMFELGVDERGAWACEEIGVDGVEGWGGDIDDGVVWSVELLPWLVWSVSLGVGVVMGVTVICLF